MRSLKNSCSKLRRNKSPKCKDKIGCQWVVKKGCKNTKRKVSTQSKLRKLKQLLREDSKYIDREKLKNYLVFSETKSQSYLKKFPKQSVNDIATFMVEDFMFSY